MCYIKWANIFLVPLKSEIMMVLLIFPNNAINILDFSLLHLVKFSLFIFFFSFVDFLSKVIALPIIAIVVALSRSILNEIAKSKGILKGDSEKFPLFFAIAFKIEKNATTFVIVIVGRNTGKVMYQCNFCYRNVRRAIT